MAVSNKKRPGCPDGPTLMRWQVSNVSLPGIKVSKKCEKGQRGPHFHLVREKHPA